MAEIARAAAAIALLTLLAGCAVTPPRAVDPPSTCATPDPATATWRALPYDAGLPRRGQWREGFELADFDADGRLDLVHGAPRKGLARPVIFRGDGRGGFAFWKEAHFPPLPYDYGDVTVADFNADGVVDLALAVHLHGVVALINEGGGHFAPWGEGLGLVAPKDTVGETVFSSRRILASDWNADGRPDLIAVNEGPAAMAAGRASADAVRIYLNRGGYWDPATLTPPVMGFGAALALGDLDADGQPDAIWGPQSGGVAELRLRPAGDRVQSLALGSLPERSAVGAVALHDLDRDGRDEALLGVRVPDANGFCNGLLRVDLERDGSEHAEWLWRAPGRNPIVALASGDIDGDRWPDLVMSLRDGSLHFFRGTRRGLVPDLRLAIPAAYAGCEASQLRLVDLDGDRRPELIASYAGDDAGPDGEACLSRGGFQAWRLERG